MKELPIGKMFAELDVDCNMKLQFDLISLLI